MTVKDDFLRDIIALMNYAFADEDKTHIHECQDCNKTWEHSNHCRGDRDAHICPHCGAGPYYMQGRCSEWERTGGGKS